MLRLGKLTDYGTLILAVMAEDPARVRNAMALAERTRIASPTVSKLLKQLQRAGLVTSSRGLHGGYQLARSADAISAGEILDALEGPPRLTHCAAGAGHCGIQGTCSVSHVWQRLNFAIRQSLQEVSLAQLAGLQRAHISAATIERHLRSAVSVEND